MTTELPINTIIVAAGSSARFGTDKMLAPLGDLPVFLHSVRNFLPVSQRLVLVVPPGREEDFAALTRQHGLLTAQMSIVAGGDTRTDSVRQGLQGLGDSASGLVAIHDAARPLASADLLLALADLAAKTGGAAPAKPMTNTVLRTDDQNLVLEALSRENLWEIETPQVFVLPILQEAFAALSGRNFTDDTQVLMQNQGSVRLLHNPAPNPKLTFPQDLDFVAFLLTKAGDTHNA